LATLIAGIQIAITQPIRIDDVVIVENEWGWIEEITLTYVVIRIWDQRRLVVPITYFIERPFQNWTRTTAELLGTVYIYADYSIPIGELRRELEKIVNASPLWDKRLAKMQVTNATEKTLEIRALISAENSSNAWELRCLVREKLMDFMQRNYPEKLPRIRLETKKEDNDLSK
jgi:small-conductance mechanosensitive channel